MRYKRSINKDGRTPKERMGTVDAFSIVGTHMWMWLALLNKLDGRGAHIS